MDNPAPDDVARLIQELKDDRRDVRSRAAYELGKHDDPRVLEPLAAALGDDDKFVRSWASGALAKAGPVAIPALLPALDDADPSVGYYAALALGEIGDLRSVPLLAQALEEGDWEIKPRAAVALAALGDEFTLPGRALTEPGLTGADRAKILHSLRDVTYTDDQQQLQFHLPDAAEFCRERSQSPDDTVRMGAVDTLQAIEASAELANEARAAEQAPVAGREEEPAPPQQPAASTPAEAAKPKRGFWERITGR